MISVWFHSGTRWSCRGRWKRVEGRHWLTLLGKSWSSSKKKGLSPFPQLKLSLISFVLLELIFVFTLQENLQVLGCQAAVREGSLPRAFVFAAWLDGCADRGAVECDVGSGEEAQSASHIRLYFLKLLVHSRVYVVV